MSNPRTVAEAAAELGVSVSWLKKAVAARTVPHRRYGRTVRFEPEDIEAIRADARRVPKTAPVPVIARGRRVA